MSPDNDNRRSSDDAMMIGRALEDYLPSFEVEIVEGVNNNRTIRIAATQELYEEFLSLTSQYQEPLAGIARELVIPAGEKSTLDIYDEYMTERDHHIQRRELIFYTMSDLDIPDEEMDRLREVSRVNGTSFEVDFIPVNDRYQRERAQRPFTFSEYQALAERMRAHAERRADEIRPEDIYLTDSAGSLEIMRQFFNDVCRFEESCTGSYGIQETPSGRIEMRISENENGEHYQTVKRLYEESRRDALSRP